MLFKNKAQIIENGQTPKIKKIREEILEILTSAYDAVDPYKAVERHVSNNQIVFESETIDVSCFENIYLVGFGKASVGMAQAVCDLINIKSGVVVTNTTDKTVKNDNVKTFVGGHPIPNEKSLEGTEEILDLVKKCNENDLLIALISGGGSALLCKPRVSLDDLQKTTDLLLKSGANINEINTVRKHISFVKGGQLVNSAKCTIISFIVSDIIGDPIEFIASGPTYPDSTTYIDAQKILKKYEIWPSLPSSARKVIEEGVQNIIPETPKENDSVFDNVFNFIVANNKTACVAAKNKAEELNYKTMLLTTSLDGEAKAIGKYLVEKATSYLTDGKKAVFIAGGETTVTIKGSGKGGRNQEMVLSGVEELAEKDVVFSSFATDGIDGMSDAAGAIADAYTLMRAYCKDLDPNNYLDDNNSYEFFRNLDDLFITGPTGTNVMDIQLLVKVA